MALINCPECNQEVSDVSTKCPQCGFIINKPKRGLFGKIFKWSFILFNLIMIYWLVAGVGTAASEVSHATSDAGQAGAAIGTALGAGLILTIWVIGDIILGMFVLFTRPKIK